MEAGLILVLLLILGAEFVNGWTDSPNAIATVVGTRSLTPLQAVIMAAALNLLGVLSGTKVAATIGKGIVDASVIDLTTVAGAMISIILWSTLAARWGIPTSETHALVAGLAGAGLATAGPSALLWEGWKKVLLGLFFSSVLGGFGGFILMIGVYWAFRRASPTRTRGTFRGLQILSSAFMAFSHGSNDGQKFMGVFTLSLVIAGVLPAFQIPLWVIFLCASVMALGTLTGGWRIIKTMGMKLTRLETHQGFAAEVAAASVIEAATRFGIPLSTTHTITSSIVGVGATRGGSAVNWGVTQRLVFAWILTFPICGFISWAVVWVLRHVLD
ncbi:MAG TPA: inorganic phosphate transporter [Thermoanaerobaculia bacterium]|nr:inorganic phosphate transporter [Thermoanaerobaculia bacterium]